MNMLLILIILPLLVMVVVSLVRGIVAFLHSTRIDLESGEAVNVQELQLKQNRMMFARIKYQALAIAVMAVLVLINR